jgi:hypothetical protein
VVEENVSEFNIDPYRNWQKRQLTDKEIDTLALNGFYGTEAMERVNRGLPAFEPTKETHVFIGTFRPPLSTVSRLDSCPLCRRRFTHYAQSSQELALNCWQQGHLDVPVYKTHEQVIAMQGAKP